jgi:hypothetical protein
MAIGEKGQWVGGEKKFVGNESVHAALAISQRYRRRPGQGNREPGSIPERLSPDIHVTEWVPDSLRSRSGFRDDARWNGCCCEGFGDLASDVSLEVPPVPAD